MKSKEITDLKSSLSRRLRNCKIYKNRLFAFDPWDLNRYNTPEKRLNNLWENKSYWLRQIPEIFYHLKWEESKYLVSSHIVLNDEFQSFIKDKEGIEQQVFDLKDGSKRYKLKERENELKTAIQQNSQVARQFLETLPDYFIDHISERSTPVEHYQYDRGTDNMVELFSSAEITFQASILGNEKAIENLLSNYTKRGSHYRETISKLVELDKEFLLHQIATDQNTKRYEEKRYPYLEQIFDDLKKIPNINDSAVIKVFENYHDNFQHEPTYGYFTKKGKPRKKPLAEALQIIYEHEFTPESISTKSIKDRFDFSVLHQFQ